jgi:2-hydroxyglutarate dehydrogenase
VDFAAVARALAEDVRAGGGRIELGAEVADIAALDAGCAIACAGVGADRLAIAAGAPHQPRIVPVRGTYLRLKPERRELVRASIYPVPDPGLPFLGAHLTRTVSGDVLLGPSALLAGGYGRPETWRLMRRFWRHGAVELGRAASRRLFVRGLRRYVPELRAADTLRAFTGVRAQAIGRDGRLVDDFVVHRTERALHVRNAPSPAATASLALARLIADQAEADPAFGGR